MINDVWHFWMEAVAEGDPYTVYCTVQFPPEFGVPQPNITGMVAISAFSQGFDQGGSGAGAVGANVTHYQHVNPQGGIEDVDVPADWIYNAIDVDQAYSVTFALTARLAWAYATVTIYFR
jgi:hypothetical protein